MAASGSIQRARLGGRCPIDLRQLNNSSDSNQLLLEGFCVYTFHDDLGPRSDIAAATLNSSGLGVRCLEAVHPAQMGGLMVQRSTPSLTGVI
jgi:hypothetical protein